MKPSVILPAPSEYARARQRLEQFKPWFEQAEEKWWGKFVPFNTRHIHDPQWRTRFWGIQAAHDKRGFWKVVWYLYLASTVAGPLWVASVAYKHRQEMNVTYRQNILETNRWYRETYRK